MHLTCPIGETYTRMLLKGYHFSTALIRSAGNVRVIRCPFLPPTNVTATAPVSMFRSAYWNSNVAALHPLIFTDLPAVSVVRPTLNSGRRSHLTVCESVGGTYRDGPTCRLLFIVRVTFQTCQIFDCGATCFRIMPVIPTRDVFLALDSCFTVHVIAFDSVRTYHPVISVHLSPFLC